MMKGLIVAVNMFLMVGTAFAGTESPLDPKKCVEMAKEAICVVNPISYSEDPNQRPCLTLPENYKERVVSTLEKLPEEAKPIFCHVKRIFIEKDFYATGYASYFYERVPELDTDRALAFRHTGWVIGLSERKIFQENWTLDSFLAHKDQTLFGRDLFDPIPSTFPFIQFTHSSLSGEELFLQDVLIHEVGHLIDFANQVNKYQWDFCFDDNDQWIEDCEPMVSGIFATLSWTPNGKQRPDAQFFDRRLCYYNNCDHVPEWSPIPLERADEFYKELAVHPYFVSSYAPVFPTEDFAETFTYFFSMKDQAMEASLYFPSSGLRRSILSELRAKKTRLPLHAKFEWIEAMVKIGLKFKPFSDRVVLRPIDMDPKIFHQVTPYCRYSH